MLRKGILYGLIFQGLSMFFTFFIVPQAITYLGNYDYGLWVTIFNLSIWFVSLDLGIGNGFRNLLARAFARKDFDKASKLIGSVMSFCTLLGVGLGFVFQLVNFLLYEFDTYSFELFASISWLLFVYSLDFTFRMTSIIYTSNLRSIVLPFVTFLSSLGIVVSVTLLNQGYLQIVSSKLLNYVLIVGSVPVLVNGLVTLFGLLTSLKCYLNKKDFFNKNIIHEVYLEGRMFFLIQVSMIVSLQLSNLFIAIWSSPDKVTLVNLADKYFGIISVGASVVLFPFWSKFTEADEKKEYTWILSTLKKFDLLFVLLLLMSGFMLYSFDYFKSYWLKENVDIPLLVSVLVLLKYLGIVYNGIYCSYLNGIGKIKQQLKLYIINGALNVPISYILYLFLGFEGVLIWSPLSVFFMAFILRRESYQDVLSKKNK